MPARTLLSPQSKPIATRSRPGSNPASAIASRSSSSLSSAAAPSEGSSRFAPSGLRRSGTCIADSAPSSAPPSSSLTAATPERTFSSKPSVDEAAAEAKAEEAAVGAAVGAQSGASCSGGGRSAPLGRRVTHMGSAPLRTFSKVTGPPSSLAGRAESGSLCARRVMRGVRSSRLRLEKQSTSVGCPVARWR